MRGAWWVAALLWTGSAAAQKPPTWSYMTSSAMLVTIPAITLAVPGLLPPVTVTVQGVALGDVVLASIAGTPPANLVVGATQSTAANTVVVVPQATAALTLATTTVAMNFLWFHSQ